MDRDYLLSRARDELRMAENATNPIARAAHFKMAKEYEARAVSPKLAGKPSNASFG
jgi:hypothetical protein